ncbi:hypothetical protein FB451DRAFT_1362561 [Mycena latifolia]|nr:hypothetical protein FB451DRAFT_1362561 [Mycena latifolia]
MDVVPQRSPKYYTDAVGHYVFIVQNTLYKLDIAALARSSEYFKNMFKMAPVAESSSDTAPIGMIDSIFEPEFEAFVSLAYGRPPRADQWPKGSDANPLLLRLLELSRYFVSQPTRELVLNVIKSRSFYFTPAHLIQISYEYRTRTFFQAAFQRLASISLRDLKPEDIEKIGLVVYVALARLKEAIQQHRCILAAEEPQIHPIHGHSADCQDKAACARDWHAIWWNGMGRFLLDGRNPLTWTDSIQQFERMDFGEMNPDCREKMLEIAHGGDGNAYVFSLISSVSDELMGGIIEDKVEEEPF